MASRILMISTSREISPQPAVPIGAAWVAQALHVAGFQVRLLDLCFERNPMRSIARELDAFRPDGIGISVRNLDNCDFLAPASFLPELREFTELIKSRSSAPILLGGAGVSIMPRQVLDYLDLDYAVVGEGERAASLFFRSHSAPHGTIPGLVTRGNRRPARPASQMSTLPVMPQTHRWVAARNYLKLEPVLPVQGKRGCANHCLYCTYNRIEGGSWRIREAASVADEIAVSMRETGAREFEFVDSIFNQPEGYLETLLEEILRRGIKARFRVSSLSPKGLTKRQVNLMERAGVASLVITPETASDLTLAALRKDFSEEDVHRAAQLLAGSGIRALWCFLMGGPGEDETTLATTIGFINSGMSKKDSAFITTGIRIYPGTGLHELAVRESLLDPSDNLLMPKFYFSHKITPQQARESLQKNLSDLSRCIFLSDTRLNCLGSFRRIGTMLRLPGPFWRYAGYMNSIAARSRVISRSWSAGPAVRE